MMMNLLKLTLQKIFSTENEIMKYILIDIFIY